MSNFWSKETSSRQGASQNVAFNAAGGASAASTAFGAQTRQIRLAVSGTSFVAGTGGVRFVIGDGTPTASATSSFLPNVAVEYFIVTPGQKVAVLGNDAGTGNLSVTEMS
jgi:outer membrane protein W